MATTVLVRDGAVVVKPNTGAGPQGTIGPGGSLTNNTGVVTTTPIGDGFLNPKIGHTITGGGAGTDVGLSVEMADGSLGGIHVHAMSTGRQVRFFRSDGLEESYFESGAFVTAKYINIGAGLVDISLAAGHPAHQIVCYPASQIPGMLLVHADVHVARQVRGFNGADPVADLYMKHDGYGYRIDMCDGSIRWPRADLEPYIGDVDSTTPAAVTALTVADFPLVINSHNSAGKYGVYLRSTDVGTIGPGFLFVQDGGGLAGDDGSNLVQWESAANVRIGNSTDQTTYNAISQHVWEIAGANCAYLTATGFHPLTDAAIDLGTTALSWRAAYLTDGLYVDDVRVVKEQGAAVADATDAASAITQINALLARCRAHGLIAT